MSVEKAGNQFRVSYRYKKKLYHESFDSEGMARARDAEVKAAKRLGTFAPPHELLDAEDDPKTYGNGMSVKEAMQDLLESYGPSNWKPNYLAQSRAYTEGYIIPLLGDESLKSLTVPRMDRFYLELSAYPSIAYPDKTVGPSTAEKVHHLLSKLASEAKRKGYAGDELVYAIENAKRETYKSEETTIWAEDEFLRALDAAGDNPQFKLWLLLSAFTSARIGELLGLRWDNVEFLPDGTALITFQQQLQRINTAEMETSKKYVVYGEVPEGVTVKDRAKPQTRLCLVGMKTKDGKAAKSRRVPLGKNITAELRSMKQAQQTLRAYLGDHFNDMGFVLAQNNGRPYEEHSIRKYLSDLCKRADLPPITPHAMRHWSVSYKLRLSGDVKAVQADSGQQNTQMVLDRYAHPFDRAQEEMAIAMDEQLMGSKIVPTK